MFEKGYGFTALTEDTKLIIYYYKMRKKKKGEIKVIQSFNHHV